MGEKPSKEASALGAALARLGAGKPKNFSEEERKKRRDRLAKLREKRWPKK
jgi:hypothetical protein